MPMKEICGTQVEVNEEGFMTVPGQWTKLIAQAIANEESVGMLAEGHWKVIDFLQKDYKEQGSMPTIRRLKSVGNIPTKELYDLFPGGPLKKASKISGLPKPASCV